MIFRLFIISAFVAITLPFARANEPWITLSTGTEASLRGLAALDAKQAWTCGSNGTVLRTIDGGSSWINCSPKGYSTVELRSIHAWNASDAIIATAGQPATILKTVDGGENWKQVYHHESTSAFFDGLRFSDEQHGIAFSDPVDKALLVLTTDDRGETWKPIDRDRIPKVDDGESGFAASNSSLFVLGSDAWIGLGGGTDGNARVFRSEDRGEHWDESVVFGIGRSASSGIFSICFRDSNHGVAVGGDYKLESSTDGNIALTSDGGMRWRRPVQSVPRGYRSCVVFTGTKNDAKWIATGPSGTDVSDNGESWVSLGELGFHALSVGHDGSVWASGSKGRVAKLRSRPKGAKQ